ncbi:hypothetical protein EDD15DRAFT_1470333 [Pisolithus albus]|nr:hypothetical protein EDD15DRAFT_1470333 [Pisolithus albus]
MRMIGCLCFPLWPCFLSTVPCTPSESLATVSRSFFLCHDRRSDSRQRVPPLPLPLSMTTLHYYLLTVINCITHHIPLWRHPRISVTTKRSVNL